MLQDYALADAHAYWPCAGNSVRIEHSTCKISVGENLQCVEWSVSFIQWWCNQPLTQLNLASLAAMQIGASPSFHRIQAQDSALHHAHCSLADSHLACDCSKKWKGKQWRWLEKTARIGLEQSGAEASRSSLATAAAYLKCADQLLILSDIGNFLHGASVSLQ